MKITRITILLFLFFSRAYGQNGHFSADKKKDSLWVKQLIEIQKKQQLSIIQSDSVEQVEWVVGKVVYSPDSCLRIGQILGKFSGVKNATYITTIQYRYQDKTIELKLPKDISNYDFQDFPITNIYKLPSPDATYLILSTEIESSLNAENIFISRYPSNEDFINIKRICNTASLVHIIKDTLEEVAFKVEEDMFSNQISEIISGNSICFDSYIKDAKHSPKPFLTYNPLKNELIFLTTSCGKGNADEGCGIPYTNVYSGIFKYEDSSFVLFSDTSYTYPSLESLTKVLAVKKIKTGNYITKAVATKKYEEVGEGILPVLHVNYHIQSQIIGYMDYTFDEESINLDVKPEFKVQKDGSLIFFVTDITVPNTSGQCGMCQDDDSKFFLIKRNLKKLMFSFSSNSGRNYATYNYNDGKSERSGRFYLKSNLNRNEDEWDSSVDKTYWKNDSTYVVRVSNETLARNFYIHFVSINKTIITRLVVGKLEHQKVAK